MKRIGNIYSKIYSMDNLRLAHKNARKDKLFYKEVKMVDSNLDYYLGRISDMLKNGQYTVSDYSVSTINDKGKNRTLMKLPYYPDRIIQWAILLCIEETFMKTFCYHTCASIKFRGIQLASSLTKKYIQKCGENSYCLKMDISKFYPSIDRGILKSLLLKKFKDKSLINLLFSIIDSCPGTKGIPIGSYLSQFLANYYLCYFDHWLKEEKGAKYVVRYMDDIIIISNSKQKLHELRCCISRYLSYVLNLKLKDNWQVFPISIRGIDFVGYRFFNNYILLRKSTCKRMKRKMRKIRIKQESNKLINYSEWCSINSYKGWLIHCNSYRLNLKYIIPVLESSNRYYSEVIVSKKMR